MRAAEHVRDQGFLFTVLPELTALRWSTEDEAHAVAGAVHRSARPYRERFRRDVGVFDAPLPLNPRTRKVAETPQWTAWDVVLDVWTDVIAWGVLVVPKDVAPGERRPVVVVQHGRNDLPRDTIDRQRSAYNDFGSALAERGFIVFAPHNLYRGEDRYRWLDRKANTITPRSFIHPGAARTHPRMARFAAVCGRRAHRVLRLELRRRDGGRIPAAPRKCAVDLLRRLQSVDAQGGGDGPALELHADHRVGDAVLELGFRLRGNGLPDISASLHGRARPSRSGGARSVGGAQYAKVRFLYAQLGMTDRTEIEFFQGAHSINGQGTLAFLHRHLRWPAPPCSRAESFEAIARNT